jgi:hypothetical protein
MILECPRCRNIITWERETQPNGPGKCECGAWAPWRFRKEMPKLEEGHVILITSKGRQELFGPRFQENPNGWKK